MTDAQRQEKGWQISTARGEQLARHLIVATGIRSEPRLPQFEGQEEYRGRVIPSVEYQRPEPYIGRQQQVVGVGNSGAEIATTSAADSEVIAFRGRGYAALEFLRAGPGVSCGKLGSAGYSFGNGVILGNQLVEGPQLKVHNMRGNAGPKPRTQALSTVYLAGMSSAFKHFHGISPGAVGRIREAANDARTPAEVLNGNSMELTEQTAENKCPVGAAISYD